MSRRRLPLIILRLFGLVLLAASALKGYALATGPVPEAGLLSSRWFLIGVVEFELVLGLWLLTGIYPKVAWAATLATFVVFSLVSLGQALTGTASCGCLGQVEINPWYTLAFDLAAVTVLVLARPREVAGAEGRSRRWRLAGVGTAALVIGVPAGVAMATFTPAVVTEDGDILGDNPVVVLEPASWVGQRFPMLKHIDHGERLGRGAWLVMLHRHECAACRDAMPNYVQLAYELAGRDSAPQVALVEVPPFQDGNSQVGTASSPCLRGRLMESRQWRINTPTFLRLHDGQVQVATQEAEVLLQEHRVGQAQRNEARRPADLPDYSKVRRHRYLTEIACGPLSLIAVIHSLGVSLTDDEKDQFIAVAGSHGTDLAQLKGLAESKGLHVLGVEGTRDKLTQIGLPAVVHDGAFGYTAILGYVNDGVRVVLPLQSPVILSPDRFDQMVGTTFRALLVSTQPLNAERMGFAPSPPNAPREGPHLSPAKTVLSVGRVYTGNWEGSLELRNDGDAALEIRGVKSSRGDVAVSVDEVKVPPGSSTRLRVRGRQPEVSRIACMVTLETNQPGNPAVIIPVRGYVEQAVLPLKPVVTMQEVLVNQAAEVEVPLDLAEGLAPENVRAVTPDQVPLSASIVRGRDGRPAVRLRWLGTRELGWHRCRVELCPDQPPDTVRARLLVAVHVVPSVQIHPPSLLLSDQELDGVWQRQVVLQFLDAPGKILDVSFSDSSLTGCCRIDLRPEKEREYRVSISPTTAGSPKDLKGRKVELRFRLSDGSSKAIPVYFGEQAFFGLERD